MTSKTNDRRETTRISAASLAVALALVAQACAAPDAIEGPDGGCSPDLCDRTCVSLGTRMGVCRGDECVCYPEGARDAGPGDDDAAPPGADIGWVDPDHTARDASDMAPSETDEGTVRESDVGDAGPDAGDAGADAQPAVCGDGVCDPEETCSACPADCGCSGDRPVCHEGACVECVRAADCPTTDAPPGNVCAGHECRPSDFAVAHVTEEFWDACFHTSLNQPSLWYDEVDDRLLFIENAGECEGGARASHREAVRSFSPADGRVTDVMTSSAGWNSTIYRLAGLHVPGSPGVWVTGQQRDLTVSIDGRRMTAPLRALCPLLFERDYVDDLTGIALRPGASGTLEIYLAYEDHADDSSEPPPLVRVDWMLSPNWFLSCSRAIGGAVPLEAVTATDEAVWALGYSGLYRDGTLVSAEVRGYRLSRGAHDGKVYAVTGDDEAVIEIGGPAPATLPLPPASGMPQDVAICGSLLVVLVRHELYVRDLATGEDGWRQLGVGNHLVYSDLACSADTAGRIFVAGEKILPDGGSRAVIVHADLAEVLPAAP